MRQLTLVVALLSAALPGYAAAEEFVRLDETLKYINEEIQGPSLSRELSVMQDATGTLILLRSGPARDRSNQLLYRVRADMLDVGKLQWMPDGTVMAACKGGARCVGAFEASTGKKILDFEYLMIGPFRMDAESRSRGEQAVCRLVQLTGGSPRK